MGFQEEQKEVEFAMKIAVGGGGIAVRGRTSEIVV